MNRNIRQRDFTDCGATCIASVAAHYQLSLPVSKIRQLAGTDQKGTNAWGLIQAATKLGFNAKGVRGTLEALVCLREPAIAHVLVNKVLLHYVVIYKSTDKYVVIMDPADGKEHKIATKKFGEIWTGVLVLLSPGMEFNPGNDKKTVGERLLFLLQPHKIVLFQALIGAAIFTLLGLSTSIYIQKITDAVLLDGNKHLLNLMSLIMLVILIFQLIIGNIKNLMVLQTGQKIDARLILGYYKHLLKLPMQFFDSMRTGEVISRINDAVKIRAFINDTVLSLIVSVFIVGFSFALMLFYNWKLTMMMAAMIPLYGLVYWITNSLNRKRERKLMEATAELESHLVESLTAVRTIKEFGMEKFFHFKTEIKFMALLESIYHSATNSLISVTSVELISRTSTILLLWAGSFLVLDHTISPGELLSFYAISAYFSGPVTNLIGMNKAIQNAMIAADRLFEIMDLDQENDTQKIDIPGNLPGNIRFHHICFQYGTRTEIFNDFSLELKKGEITAIIGESGSGKTTLAGLLQKLYPLTSGHIYLGEFNLQDISIESLRNHIAVVPQKLDLFNGSLLENIALGELSPDIERVTTICNNLGMRTFVENLPHGYHTLVGENGTMLSGGEKQRVAIARALYREPEIMLLDEATSSLDNESEQFVMETVRRLKAKGKTILIIAHRLSTILEADKIVVLERGCLVEEGTHEKLWSKRGRYYEMWQKQLPETIYSTTREFKSKSFECQTASLIG